MKSKIKEICIIAEKRLESEHIGVFPDMKRPIFMISEQYPGVWLEHLYDSVMYARLYPDRTEYLENIINLFIDRQTEKGQLPCYIFNQSRVPEGTELTGYGQVQECLSFASVCLMAYDMIGDKAFLKRCFEASKKWAEWIKANRMTRGEGLPEMFFGFDTGHDRSGRLIGMSCRGNYTAGGVLQNAAVLPPDDGVTPIIAVDMCANLYGNLTAISEMAKILNLPEEAKSYADEARALKKRLFEVCLDRDDAFFYDVGKNGEKRKIKSSAFLHLFLEGVLNPAEDAALIAEIYTRHIKNPEEFWTPYPLPSMAYNDPTASEHEDYNSWGYFCQMLIYLRCTLWMDKYGFSEDFDFICEKVLTALTNCFDEVKLGQELDPITGKPSPSSEWYSSAMLFYIYASRRLGCISEKKPPSF